MKDERTRVWRGVDEIFDPKFQALVNKYWRNFITDYWPGRSRDRYKEELVKLYREQAKYLYGNEYENKTD